MSIQKLKQKHFKNVICITTTDDGRGRECREEQINSEAIKKRTKAGDLILFIYGGSRKTKLTPEDNHFNLYLSCPEEYKKLAKKTFETIKFCCRSLKFDRLYKGDDTKLIPLGLCDFDHHWDVDLLGIGTPKRSRNGARTPKWSNDDLNAELSPCQERTFKKWAKKKGIWVDTNYYDPNVWYSGWKPYGISNKFARIIAKYGSGYEQLYCDYLGGCEDHMVGKIWKDLEIAFDLKMR